MEIIIVANERVLHKLSVIMHIAVKPSKYVIDQSFILELILNTDVNHIFKIIVNHSSLVS